MKEIDRIAELEQENAELKQTLQEIKAIAKDAPAIDTELSQRILEVITKAEVGE